MPQHRRAEAGEHILHVGKPFLHRLHLLIRHVLERQCDALFTPATSGAAH